MKEKLSKKLKSTAFILLALSAITSCSRKAEEPSPNSLDIQLSSSNISEIQEIPHSHTFSNKKILVLFGYDFNSEDFENEIIPKIHPSVWPPKMHTPNPKLNGKTTP